MRVVGVIVADGVEKAHHVFEVAFSWKSIPGHYGAYDGQLGDSGQRAMTRTQGQYGILGDVGVGRGFKPMYGPADCTPMQTGCDVIQDFKPADCLRRRLRVDMWVLDFTGLSVSSVWGDRAVKFLSLGIVSTWIWFLRLRSRN